MILPTRLTPWQRFRLKVAADSRRLDDWLHARGIHRFCNLQDKFFWWVLPLVKRPRNLP